MNLNGLRKIQKLTTIDAIGSGAAVALTLVLVFGVWAPLNARSRQLAASRQTAARERQRLAGLVTAIRALRTEIGTTQEQIDASPLRILPKEFLNRRLGDLAAFSSQSSLTVEEMRPGDPVRQPHFLVVPIRMAGHGSYRNCTIFIHVLHERLGDVVVSSFKLFGFPDQPAAATSFELELRWFATSGEPSPEHVHLLTTASTQ